MWTDEATLELLEFVLTDYKLKRFLLCTSYCNNEVDAAHLLTKWQENLKENIESAV
jgi:hypothetical protein